MPSLRNTPRRQVPKESSNKNKGSERRLSTPRAQYRFGAFRHRDVGGIYDSRTALGGAEAKVIRILRGLGHRFGFRNITATGDFLTGLKITLCRIRCTKEELYMRKVTFFIMLFAGTAYAQDC